MFEAQFQEYPEIVQVRTKYIVNENAYSGACKVNFWGCEIKTAPSEHIFRHEMGHATANILGIEQELGQMVANLPTSTIRTNDNIFSYGAYIRTLQGFDRAVQEYAAIAIEYYYMWEDELPPSIRKYLDGKLN